MMVNMNIVIAHNMKPSNKRISAISVQDEFHFLWGNDNFLKAAYFFAICSQCCKQS